MKFTELKKKLAEGDVSPVYLIEGDDAWFRERSVEMLKGAFVSEPQLNFAAFSGEAVLAAPEELLSAADAYPFMSRKRMVLVREFYPKAEALNGVFGRLFRTPAAETVLVLENGNTSDALKKLPNTTLIDCQKADVSILRRWIAAEAAKNGVTIGTMEAEKLAEFCNRDMTKISRETEKLVAYAGNGGMVTAEDVNLLVTKDTEYQVYALTDYIGKRRYDDALTVLREMTAKGESPQRLITITYNYFRRMLHISLSKYNDAELAKMLGVAEYAVKKAREQAKTFKRKALKKAVDYLSDCDYACKTGRTTFEDSLATAIFEILV